MANIKITADRTADLPEGIVEQYKIDLVPLYIILNGQSYRDSVDIQPDEIYDYAERTGRLPKTSAATIQEYTDLFARYSKSHDAVIHINLGAGFSSTYQNAKIASEEFDNVYVVNSDNLSTGTGHLVMEAVKLREQGLSAPEIVKELERIIPKVETSFVIDTLDYLKMGGRCSSITAISANLLNIKPSIEVINGKMEVGKKYRGKIEKTIEKYVIDRLKNRDDIIKDRVFITHSGCPEKLINRVEELVQEYQSFTEIYITRASCTISSHCGPNTLGVLFIRK